MSIETAMVLALAEIDRELGLPEDGCNSTVRTLNAIRLLHAAHRDDVRALEKLERGSDALAVWAHTWRDAIREALVQMDVQSTSPNVFTPALRAMPKDGSSLTKRED